MMKQKLFSLNTMRLALSGSIIGVAIMGLISLIHPFSYHNEAGALLGFLSTFFAKSRHLF